ncbi:polysaccharide biosynthesis C-terminal domain-containing protein [Thiotrichales bacterium 19X7-9]|nr:polysaccharide biosynthesis C-terminal domain-containing protein [Thiotrichales bacterium 19X7-9]
MRKNIIFGLVSSFISMCVSIFGGVIQSAFIIRYLSLFDAGVWFVFLSIVMLLAFCDFGLSPTLSREIGLSSAKQSQQLRISILYKVVSHYILVLSILMFLLFAILYFVLVYPKSDNEYVLLAFILFSLACIFRFISNPALAVIYGCGKVALNKNILTFSSLVNFILGCLFLYSGFGLSGISFAYFIGYLLLYIIARLVVFRQLSVQQLTLRLSTYKVVFFRIWNPCLQWTIMTVGAVLILQISSLMIAFVIGVDQVAYYAVIRQLCTAILSTSGIIGLVLVPFISIAKGKGDTKQIHDFFEFTVKFATMLAIIGAVLIYFYQGAITSIWFDGKITFNHYLLILMLITTVLEVHHVACAQVCLATGYVRFALISIIAGIISVILNYFLISKFGIVGAGLAILLSQILTNNWFVVLVSIRHLKIAWYQYLTICFQLLLYLFFQFVVQAVLQYYLENQNAWVQLVIASIVALVASVVYMIIFLQKERKIVMKWVKG